MKHGFFRTSIALGVALFLGSGTVLADPAVDKSNNEATSLNTSPGSTTSIGNARDITLNGTTTVNGNISTTNGTVSGVAVSAGTSGLSSTGGANISGTSTTINSATNQIGAATSNNTISGVTTTIDSATNTIGVANSSTNIIQGDTATITGTSRVTATSGNSNLALLPDSAQGARVDAAGKITMGTLDQSTAALTVTNGQGNTHGFVVNETSATMSGGTHSTSLTLNDGGARFSNASSGGPVRVTGVAAGRHDYDAVNYRQLKSVKAGIAGIAAMTNIPQVEQYKKFTLGIGLGHYDGTTAMAVGASARLSENAVIKASISNGIAGGGSRKSTVYGVGAGFSW